MGVLQSIPLCAREKTEDGVDTNNNEPMPSAQAAVAANADPVKSGPLAVIKEQPSQLQLSLTNPNASLDIQDSNEVIPPDATSTPKAGSRLNLDSGGGGSEDLPDINISLNEEYYDEEGEEEEEDLEGDNLNVAIDEGSSHDDSRGSDRSTSDSGLEQSSSDELELGAVGLKRPKSVAAQNKRTREHESPGTDSSASGQDLHDRQPPPLPTDQSNDEGINDTTANNTLDVTLPMFENHLTCDEDEEEEDEEEDPVERPPEPTVPDERVDSSSGSSGESSRRESVSPSTQQQQTRKKSQQEVMVDAFTKAFTEDALPSKNNNNSQQAISSMLSDIVGSDKPYQKYEDGVEQQQQQQQPSFAMRLQDEATSR